MKLLNNSKTVRIKCTLLLHINVMMKIRGT